MKRTIKILLFTTFLLPFKAVADTSDLAQIIAIQQAKIGKQEALLQKAVQDIQDLKSMMAVQNGKVDGASAGISSIRADLVVLAGETSKLSNTTNNLVTRTTAVESVASAAKAEVSDVNSRTRNMISDPQGTRFRADGNGRWIHLQNDFNRIWIEGVGYINP